MFLTALCPRRSVLLQLAASIDKAGLNWWGGQSSPDKLLERVTADKPRFALITESHIDNPFLFTDLRLASPDILIIVCLTPETNIDKPLWSILDNLDFDMLCTLAELTDCLITLKENRFYHSSLLATHPAFAAKEAIPGWHELTCAERRVLKSTAEGQTGPQTAAELNMGQKTVNNHKAKISQKLGVTGGLGSLTKFVLTNQKRMLALLE